MDKKSKIITCISIAIILAILIVIAIVFKYSNGVPGITAYSESGTTAETIIGGYTWNTFLKSISADSLNSLEIEYGSENTLLVKPGEKITLRNSGKDFDNYKFYKNYLKYYDSDENIIDLNAEEAINTISKSVTFVAPMEEDTYIFDISLNYHRYGNVEYRFKLVVSNMPSYKVESLLKYKNTYIGDAVRVNQILNALPYNEHKDGIILRTTTKPYELIVYYKDLDIKKETLLNNSVAIFALIDNVDIITYELDEKTYIYTRNELETIFGRDINEYVNDAELWKKEVFYNEKDTGNKNNFTIYNTIFSRLISKINSDYIVIDLDSFKAIPINENQKKDLLKGFAKNEKIILEANSDEVRKMDKFKGILLYAENVSEDESGGYMIDVIKYDTENKQEKIVYHVTSDGIIVE